MTYVLKYVAVQIYCQGWRYAPQNDPAGQGKLSLRIWRPLGSADSAGWIATLAAELCYYAAALFGVLPMPHVVLLFCLSLCFTLQLCLLRQAHH